MELRRVICRISGELSAIYPENEAKAVAREAVCSVSGMCYTSLLASDVVELTDRQLEELSSIVGRLKRYEPLQYVLGCAWFCGRRFAVAPGVLIPRPETEELVSWVIRAESERGMARRILDIGTGSGCIAVTLALSIVGVDVDAVDISPEALRVAESNAASLGAAVKFRRMDILSTVVPDMPVYDVIVSNPPYVMERERAGMERNVLDYEPSAALFVPDDDPLLFYRAIAAYARGALSAGGALYFEINGLLGEETAQLVSSMGFADVELRRDLDGRPRMLRAIKL